MQEYQLVVVDEAHNYRNPDAPTRAAVLRKLLWGQRRDVLLLTATPVNNSLWDLFHLLRFYVRQDAFLADRGILSIRERFEMAAREDPSALSPDVLYPIIDATTVKRTRQFVKKHYGGDTIRLPDGREATIVFPTPQAMTVRYALPDPFPSLFDQIETVLDPAQGSGTITFARYTPELFLRKEGDGSEPDEQARAAATVGLLRSGLLKRFESSVFAFGKTLDKLVGEHRAFLGALDRGHVVTTRFMRELSASDEGSLDDLLTTSAEAVSAGDYDTKALRDAVGSDLEKLNGLCAAIKEITPDRDPKLAAVVTSLEQIATEAEGDAISEDDARQKRKVIVFSFFADTVQYLREQLAVEIGRNNRLAAYRGRIVAVSGGDVEPDEVSRRRAVAGFAPISMEAGPGAEDLYDLMIATDVLAEGVNLQQARNIVNYDLPWNPMRLVQRHGRIDRIGSQHAKVFLRTIFPADRLDQLLNLEQRIMQKIAMAAASIGVVPPVQGGAAGRQVFSETREEIERLLQEDPTLYERGGSGGAGQTGEEYRQTLRKALEQNAQRIPRMPKGAGSGMVKGTSRGVFFCGVVGERTYLRFVNTDSRWQATDGDQSLVRELGTCLRLVECDEATSREVPQGLEDAVYDLWEVAREDIWTAWMRETDPANLQPKVRPLNQRVAQFIRAHRPPEDDGLHVNEALDILEAPWPRREEILLREWFNDQATDGVEKARGLVRNIRETGLERFNQPQLLPPIAREDIELLCWLGIGPVM